MNARRISSRRVALTASFLALAAGGVAACDSPAPSETQWAGDPGVVVEETTAEAEEPVEEEPVVEESTPAPVSGAGEVFYCADEEGVVVDEDFCDDEDGGFFLWHSTSYPRNAPPGTRLKGGGFFPAGDAASRRAFSLPETGRVANSTIKTNVVGRGSGSSTSGGSTSSGGDTSSGSTSSGG